MLSLFFFVAGPNPRSEPPLLLDSHQLPEERAGAEDADEPQQKVLDGRTFTQRLQRPLQSQPGTENLAPIKAFFLLSYTNTKLQNCRHTKNVR